MLRIPSHLANRVVLVAYAWCAPNTPYLLTRSVALSPPPAAVALVPLAGARVQIFSDPPTKKAHLAVCFSLAEKERFELSRRYSRPTPLAGAPLRPLEYFSVYSPQAAGCIGLRHPILYTAFPLLSSPFFRFPLFFCKFSSLLDFWKKWVYNEVIK